MTPDSRRGGGGNEDRLISFSIAVKLRVMSGGGGGGNMSSKVSLSLMRIL